MRSTTPWNHAEYYSLRDRQLQGIGACSEARHEAFSWTRLPLDANPIHLPHQSQLATRALGQIIENAVTVERLKKGELQRPPCGW
jgi:hypothetical protein